MAIVLINLCLQSTIWVVGHTNFKGKIFMTHATKKIYKLLLSYVMKIKIDHVEDMLYNKHD